MTNYQFNSVKRPKNFPHHFDAHIYYEKNDHYFLEEFINKLAASFNEEEIFIGDIIPIAIGPHSLPMLEINFTRDSFSEVVWFLMKNRGDLNILVHSISDNDLYDHTQGALWLGQVIPLDFSRFK